MMNKKTIMRFLFLHYTYVISLLFKLIYILPPFLRWFIFKLIVGKFGKRVFIGSDVFFRYPKKIHIGDDVSINRNCSFYPSYYDKNAKIILKNNIRIGPNCNFFAAGHNHKYLDLPDNAGEIVVEDNVWIGGGATILQAVTISEGTIIASGSVVTKTTEEYGIYGGIPAKLIKYRKILKPNDKI